MRTDDCSAGCGCSTDSWGLPRRSSRVTAHHPPQHLFAEQTLPAGWCPCCYSPLCSRSMCCCCCSSMLMGLHGYTGYCIRVQPAANCPECHCFDELCWAYDECLHQPGVCFAIGTRGCGGQPVGCHGLAVLLLSDGDGCTATLYGRSCLDNGNAVFLQLVCDGRNWLHAMFCT